MDLSVQRIVIIGAGPTGLATARLLALRGITASVLERDHDRHARTQGGSLDLTEGRGLRAIDAMGLRAEFDRVARPEGQEARIVDTDGDIVVEMDEETMGTARPEIDRRQLREMLIDSLPEGMIRWGTRVVDVTRTVDGATEVTVETAAGSQTILADLVIACDGIWSRARHLVTDDKPAYIGITYIHGDIEHPSADSYVSRLVRNGSVVAVGTGHSIGLQRHADGGIRVYFMVTKPAEDLPERGQIADRESILAELRTTYEGWAPELTGILDQISTEFEFWPLYTLPVHPVWHDHDGVTLVGDAAHVMPPFTGQGVNHGLLDAVELVDALTNPVHDDLRDALTAYEESMLPRAAAEAVLANSDDEKMLSGIAAVLAANHIHPLPLPRVLPTTSPRSDDGTLLMRVENDADVTSSDPAGRVRSLTAHRDDLLSLPITHTYVLTSHRDNA
jgi:2-polyprenyl-6-methoxyphenol hydroxylase-like FAD-dependent oxidoreductase